MELPEGYWLERDSDVLVLRVGDGRFVAAFSTIGATDDAVWAAAWEDVPDHGERAPIDSEFA